MGLIRHVRAHKDGLMGRDMKTCTAFADIDGMGGRRGQHLHFDVERWPWWNEPSQVAAGRSPAQLNLRTDGSAPPRRRPAPGRALSF